MTLLIIGIGSYELIAILVILSFLVAWFVGRHRKITFLGSFIVCLLLSPLIGLIISLLTRKVK